MEAKVENDASLDMTGTFLLVFGDGCRLPVAHSRREAL